MTRPKDLPDFTNPPLNEVLLGLQFNQVRGYQQIYARDVWELFRNNFPRVEEQIPLPPAFETFGLPYQTHLNIGIASGPMHDRFWFLSESRDEIIQFQSDRLLHNWRKVGDQSNVYPRFENMIEKFTEEARSLAGYFSSLGPDKTDVFSVNQCEVSYINHIYPSDSGETSQPGFWLNFVDVEQRKLDDFNIVFRELILGDNGRPNGRIICEARSALDQKGQKIIALNITARGAPVEPNLTAALDFLKRGREMIVRMFAAVTTDSAHKIWGRSQ